MLGTRRAWGCLRIHPIGQGLGRAHPVGQGYGVWGGGVTPCRAGLWGLGAVCPLWGAVFVEVGAGEVAPNPPLTFGVGTERSGERQPLPPPTHSL